MPQTPTHCPICNNTSASYLPVGAGETPLTNPTPEPWSIINCPKCGGYAIAESERGQIEADREKRWHHWQVRALLQERHTMTSTLPKFCVRPREVDADSHPPQGFVQISIPELLTRWPRTMGERLDRCLGNLSRRCGVPGRRANVMAGWPHVEQSLLFGQDDNEGQFNLGALIDRGYIKQTGGDPKVLTSLPPAQDGRMEFVLTAGGWERLEKIERSSPKNPAFVAMWFGDKTPGQFDAKEMERVYLQGIRGGVVNAGYRATRVDMEEHNDSIMDQVLAGIRAAPFMVADFTGHRNGVYFEAGFAKGLGTPVIFTCHQTQIGNAHFDTSHINHVVWSDTQDLCKKLQLRIEATIGKGPFMEID